MTEFHNSKVVLKDYDTSDKLYFEPLTAEDVLSIYEKEKPEGIIVQFGGQTPLNLANELAQAGVNIIGTSPDVIDLAEDRDRFRQKMRKLGIPQPESGMASNIDEALAVARQIGYPLMVRPSYVLGGRAMEVVHDDEMLREYVRKAVDISPERPILIDKFLENAIECTQPVGRGVLYWGMISAVVGISIFALGVTFNYLVSLFYKRPIGQGLFGKPIFDPSLDHHFGWMGLVVLALGLVLGIASLVLGLNGWEIARLWLYMLGSAMMILVGVQLVIYWILMRVLEELSQRDDLTRKDLGAT